MKDNKILALVPVRITHQAKHRLASLFNSKTRIDLVHEMLKDVFKAIQDSRYISHIIFVCSDRETRSHLQSFESEIFFTQKQGLNEELKLAAEYALEFEPAGIIYILADLPLMTGLIIDRIVQTGLEKSSSVIASDWHGTGTNVLFIQPPTAFKPHFGPNSFERHHQIALSFNHPLVNMTFPDLEPNLDIDDWESIQVFLKKSQKLLAAQKTFTYLFLQRILSEKKKNE